MCATYEFRERVFRPGREIVASAKEGLVRPVWAGFARCEILAWWVGQGGELLDIPAGRFAERSEKTRQLVWDDVPEGLVIRGVMQRSSSGSLVRIVTRAATGREQRRFQHPRMPLLEGPIHQAFEYPENPVAEESDAQGLLF
jgi:hypothetical protein